MFDKSEDKWERRARILYPTMKDKEDPKEIIKNKLVEALAPGIKQLREDILYPTMKSKKEEGIFTGGAASSKISETINNNSNKHNILLKGYISYDKSDKNFNDSLVTIFGHEGGYTNDPDDLGGPTNMGITQSTYNSYCKKHNIKTKDVKNITRKEAIQVYYEDYWKSSGADKIEHPIEALIMFDTAVLHGVGRAKQLYKASNGDFNKFLELRQHHYEKRVKENPSQVKYLKGWNNRVKNLSKKLNDFNNMHNY